MKFHKLDGPGRTHQAVQTTEVLNVRLLIQILALAEEDRFTQRKCWDSIAEICGVHRTTIYKTLAAAERMLGVIIRIDPEEARPRIFSWGALSPEWVAASIERVAVA